MKPAKNNSRQNSGRTPVTRKRERRTRSVHSPPTSPSMCPSTPKRRVPQMSPRSLGSKGHKQTQRTPSIDKLAEQDVFLSVLELLSYKELPKVTCAAPLFSRGVAAGRRLGLMAKPARLMVLGGQREPGDRESALSSVEIYDPIQQQWLAGPPMQTPRTNPSAAVVGSDVYVIGGADNKAGAMLDLQKGTWEAIPVLSRVYAQAMLTEVCGQLYAVGLSNEAECSIIIERYVHSAKCWEVVSTRILEGGWIGSCRATGLEGRIYLVAWGSATDHGMVEAYDVKRERWMELAPTLVRRSQHALTTCDGFLYAIGGVGAATRSMERYDPASNSWSLEDSCLDRSNTATVACDGKIVAVGGFGPRSKSGLSVDTLQGGRWAPMPSLLCSRIHPALVSFPA